MLVYVYAVGKYGDVLLHFILQIACVDMGFASANYDQALELIIIQNINKRQLHHY